MTIGIKTENMDLTTRPGDDFYDYATLGWRNANPIPDDYTRYGSFDVLHATALERVRDIAEHDTGKIGDLWHVIMDAEKLNADGTAPARAELAKIDAITSRDQLPEFLGNLHRSVSAFWGDGVELDETDSDHYLYNLYQGGVGLSRDYFFDTDEKSKTVREKYREYIARQMENFGIAADAGALYAIEERMAKSFHTKEVLRDPHANYHKMTLGDIRKKFTGFDWDAYLAARGAWSEQINIAQPGAIAESIAIMNDTDLELIKTYLKWRVINSGVNLLDDKTYDIAFDFYNRTIAGQAEPKPRWKRAVSMLDASLGEMVGQLYVKKYFPAAAKERMTQLVENLRRALGMRIENAEWMSDETRIQALKKLSTFHAKIGYPDKWRDYSKLDIRRDASLWENMTRVAEFEDAFWLNKIGAQRDPSIWYMNAHEVNAYYHPSTNEICFPAGILDYPFFDMNADDAFNYGAIGSIIGHEMTHGFDDSGRHFDANGNMREWWTDADAKNFEDRADVMRKFFDNILVAPDMHANGTFTLGENLADYGGLTVAYTAYKNFATPAPTVDGLTGDMRFFIAYAGAEAGNIRPDAIIDRTKTDEHSLSQWRVNGILPHINAWYDAFGVTDGDKMYVAPEKRVKIW